MCNASAALPRVLGHGAARCLEARASIGRCHSHASWYAFAPKAVLMYCTLHDITSPACASSRAQGRTLACFFTPFVLCMRAVLRARMFWLAEIRRPWQLPQASCRFEEVLQVADCLRVHTSVLERNPLPLSEYGRANKYPAHNRTRTHARTRKTCILPVPTSMHIGTCVPAAIPSIAHSLSRTLLDIPCPSATSQAPSYLQLDHLLSPGTSAGAARVI